MKAETKKTLFSFYDTAARFLSACGEPPSPLPVFADDSLPAAQAPSAAQSAAESDAPARAMPAGAARAFPPAASADAGGFASLEEIAQAVAVCRACPLAENRRRPVPGTGAKDAFVLIVGEGPGADEDASGLPFVGRSGQLLDKMLAAISLSRNVNVYIANIVKCRPPGNREPAPQESAACEKFLKAQIALLRPKAILALGRTAAHNLLKTTEGITRMHGRFFDFGGIPLMPTYHPSALLRDESLKRPAWEDLKGFREKLRGISPDYEREFGARTGNR